MNDRETVREPDNSTVDDWFGQNVARDQEVADEVEAEADDEAQAEKEFEQRADGKQRYEEGHPDDQRDAGDAGPGPAGRPGDG